MKRPSPRLLAPALALLAAQAHADPDAAVDASAPVAALADAAAPPAIADASAVAVAPDASVVAVAPDASVIAVAPDASVVAVASDASVVAVASDASVVAVASDASVVAVPAAPTTDAPPDVDVANYTLDARLDPTRHEVHGEGTLRWRNTSRVSVRDLWFHLYLNGFADERSLFLRTTGGAHRGNARGRYGRIDLHALRLATGEDLLATGAYDPAVPDDRSQLHVTLPREVAPGEEVTLAMRFTSVLPEAFARTGYRGSFHMVGQWFPKIAVLERDGRWAHFAFHGNSEFYADFGRYDVTVTVPAGFTVGATGQPVFVERTADTVRTRFNASPVHDFAFTAWDHFREARDESGDVAIRVLHPPGWERVARATIDCLRRAMPAYAHRFGAYPYPGLTVVVPPREAEGAGGMEYPTLITTGSEWYMPEGVRATDYVTLHEFMHQYFYGLVASNEHDAPFLDEGFTEYATDLGLEDLYGPGGPFVELPWLGLRVEAFALEADWSGLITHPLAVTSRADQFPDFGVYATHVYSRTASTLRTLEGMVGRERMRLAMRAYTDAWRFRHPTADDFFASMSASLGAPVVDSFLRPALERPSRLDFAVTRVQSHRVGDRWVGEVIVRRDGDLDVPVDVQLEDAQGHRRTVRWRGPDPWVSIPWNDPVALRAARVDPYRRVALDAVPENNARLADDAPAPPTFPAIARVAWWFGLILQAVSS